MESEEQLGFAWPFLVFNSNFQFLTDGGLDTTPQSKG